MTQSKSYDVKAVAAQLFQKLMNDSSLPIPEEARKLANKVNLIFPEEAKGDPLQGIFLPCPFKEMETITALKGVEASIANAIGKLRFGYEQKVDIDIEHATLFLLMAYLGLLDGWGKQDKEVKAKLPDTDLLAAQSNLYRRMSANLYKTKNDKYFHIHGSLEASTTLNMIGLPSHDETMTDYNKIIKTIGAAVNKFTSDELEKMNKEKKQAGVTCYTHEEFLQTPHGKDITSVPFWDVETLESQTPAVPFPDVKIGANGKPQILAGFKVIELCRIIAGPTITRVLAEYGATVIKVTGPNLSDVPFFQVDCNIGKHTTQLNLKDPKERAIFEENLLKDADIIVDGYRTGVFEKLGYGPQSLKELGIKRGKGYIYVSENCFGFKGEWSYRPGWQQIADCASGIAYAQGKFMGLDEPVVPPFPMSDYGTGCMGAIAALSAVYNRATKGGSYWGKTSLIQYDLLLLDQGNYPDWLQDEMRRLHSKEFFQLKHYDSVDRISAAALRSVHNLRPDILGDNARGGTDRHMDTFAESGFGGPIKVLKPVVKMDKTWNGFNCSSRPNAFDKPEWF